VEVCADYRPDDLSAQVAVLIDAARQIAADWMHAVIASRFIELRSAERVVGEYPVPLRRVLRDSADDVSRTPAQ
jgi:hypothetical protein